MTKIQIDATNSIQESYRLLRKLEYTVQSAIYEYVDNSLQSITNTLPAFKKHNVKPEFYITIIYKREDRELHIVDNAGGMDEKDIRRAFTIGRAPTDKSGLSEFGLGMKGASQWLATNWSVETKPFMDSRKFIIDVDDRKMDPKSNDLAAEISENEPKEDHYTKIKLFGLLEKISITQLNNMLEMVGATYSRYIEANFVRVTLVDQDKGTKKDAIPYFSEGKDKILPYEYKVGGVVKPLEKEFTLEIDNGLGESDSIKKVKVRAVVFIPGSAKKAGIHYFRRQRIIQGGRQNGLKPKEIFSSPNSFQSQRLWISADFDNWEVASSKRQIRFLGNSYERFISALRKKLVEGDDFIALCSTAQKITEGDSESTPTPIDIKEAADPLVEIFEDQIMNADAEVISSPLPIETEDKEKLSNVRKEREADITIKGGKLSFANIYVYLQTDEPSQAPYCEWSYDIDTKEMVLALNVNHKYMMSLGKDNSRLTEFIIHTSIDAIIQNRLKIDSDERAGLILKLKNNYLNAASHLDINSN